MENHKVAVARVRPGMSALLLVVFAMVLAGFCNPAWAGVSATITQGWPEASPDTVPAGGDSTLYYSVTITGLDPNESVSSQVVSQSYTFTSDQQTEINGIVGRAVVTRGPASASTFTVEVVGSSQVEGRHSVAFATGSESEITLSNGTVVPVQPGTPAPVDTFTVAKNVVTVAGDPYCIIPGSGTSDWSSAVTSKYTATTNFSQSFDSMYNWSGSSNTAAYQGATFSGWDYYEGAPSPGPGDVSCAVMAEDGTWLTGDDQVTVQNQYVNIVNAQKTQTDGTPQMVGEITYATRPGQVMTIAKGTGFSASVTEGLSINASSEVTDFVKASLGVSLSSTQLWSWITTTSLSSPLTVGDYYQAQETPVMEVQTGIEQTWGPNGLEGSTPWTNPEPDTAILQIDEVSAPK